MYIRAVRPGSNAADVGQMGRAGEQGDRLSAAETRRRQHEVVEVTGAHPGIVGDVDVALAHGLGADLAHEVLDRLRHGVDVAGRAGHRLGEHPAFEVEDARRQIAALAHDRAEGRAQESQSLLFDDGKQPTPHDLQADLVESLRAAHLAGSGLRSRMIQSFSAI